MAQNIFDATLDVNNEIKVNTFDWSHANNLTTQIGRVTPIFCDLLPAKSSFRVNPRIGLQFMPMVFPIQTRMKARVMFFKYPLRALWKGYRDFVGNFRQDLEEPYLNFNTAAKLKAMASTGSLGDYLGLPTTVFGQYGQSSPRPMTAYRAVVLGNKFGGDPEFTYLKNYPIMDMDMFAAFLAQSTPEFRNGNPYTVSLTNPATSSSSSDESIGTVFQCPDWIPDSIMGASYRLKFYIKMDTKPSDDQISVFVNRSFVGLSVSNNATVFFTLNFLSSSWDDKAHQMVLQYSFGQDFLDYNLKNPGQKYMLRFFINSWSSIGRRTAGNNTAWSLTRSSDALWRSNVLENAVVFYSLLVHC